MAELDVLVTRFDQLDKRMADAFAALNTRFDDVNHRFADVNHRFDDINHRLDDFTSRLSTVEGRMTSIDTRLDGKASQGLVHFWGGFATAWTSILVGIVVAAIKLWP